MQPDKLVQYIVNWLKAYADESRMNGFIVGISGGIDSALVSTLCAQTGFPVLGVDMPIHQAPDQINLAEKHLDHLTQEYENVDREYIDLTSTFDEMTKAFPTVDSDSDRSLALANTRARLRMTTLYYFAGLHRYLVTGTGNKIEDFGIGFFTKYGDGGVDLSPIGDLMKSEVYALAAHLNIDKAIRDAEPTDGLWGDNRSDEDQIGASYTELEWAMRQFESGKSVQDFSGRELEVFELFLRRHQINRHKWRPVPVCGIPEKIK